MGQVIRMNKRKKNRQTKSKMREKNLQTNDMNKKGG